METTGTTEKKKIPKVIAKITNNEEFTTICQKLCTVVEFTV